jgi:glycosyltransferase involved in cell wall biosynthesis
MKIMIVSPYFYPKVGGLENYALNIAKGLKSQRHDVFVVTSNHEGRKRTSEKVQGLRVIRLPRLFKLSNTPINPLWRWQLKKIIKQEKPDVINAHTPVPYIADMAIRAAGNTPVVLTYHNDLVKSHGLGKYLAQLYYLLYTNKSLNKADKVIATSDYYAKASRYLAKQQAKLGIVSPGIDTKRFNEKVDKQWLKKKYPDKKNVLFVGSMDASHAHKGVDVLLRAVAKAKKYIPNIQLVAAGDGDAVPKYKALAQELGIAENVDFTGFVSDKLLPRYYAGADVFVLPSTNESEGFGMVLIEAQACGTPVIGARVGGIPYAIQEGVTGELISANSESELTNRIVNLLDNSAELKRYGIAAKVVAFNEYNWEDRYEKTERILKKATHPKVCLVHNIVSPYRLPVYEAINDKINLTVLFCKPITKDRVWTYDLDQYTFNYKILSGFSLGPVIFNTNALSALLKTKFDILMVNSDPDIAPTALLGFLIAKLRSKKILIWSLTIDKDIHFFPALAYSNQPIQRMLRSIIGTLVMIYRRLCFYGADHFLAFTQHAQIFLEQQGIPKADISRTYQIMPLELLPEPNTKAKRNGKTFLYLGYLNERKGVNYLIEAFKQIEDPMAQLIIAGTGPTEAALKTQAKNDRRISFVGYVEGQAKANLYARADIFILPTLLDVWGLVINEAIRYGLAIICSDAAMAKEIISSDVGQTFNVGDVFDLQKRMEEMLKNQKRLRQIQKFNSSNIKVTNTSTAAEGYIKAAKAALT